MNAPIKLAQASTSGAAEIRTVKIEKPADGKAVLIQLSTNQTIKVDFSGIANERIIIVRVGERAVILFDNGATVTLDPFWDSLHRPLANLEIEFAPGQILPPGEFLARVPVTVDQSILPAAGEGGDPREAGANFSDPSVDPIASPPPLDLLPPTELGTWESFLEAGALLDEGTPPLVFGEPISGMVEEEELTGRENQSEAGFGNEDPNDTEAFGPDPVGTENGNDTDTTNPDGSIATDNILLSFSGILSGVVGGGVPPYTFSIFDVTADADVANDLVRDVNGNVVTSLGDDVSYVYVSSTVIEGRASDGRLVFTLTLSDGADPNTNETFLFELNDQIDHPDPSSPVDDGTFPLGQFEETMFLDLSGVVQVTDSAAQTAVLGELSAGPVFTMGVIDDTPTGDTESVPGETTEISEIGVVFVADYPIDDEDQTPAFPPGSPGIQFGPGDDGDGTTTQGSINILYGADLYDPADPTVPQNPLTISLTVLAISETEPPGAIPLQAVYVNAAGDGVPEPITTQWVDDPLLGGGTLYGYSAHFTELGANPVFTLVVDVDGNYTFTANAPLAHPLTDDPESELDVETEYEDNLTLQFTYVATDYDGDQFTGKININVDDDTGNIDVSASYIDPYTYEDGVESPVPLLNLDESIDSLNDGFNPDPADGEDVYNADASETGESVSGDPNGDLDDVEGNTAPDPTGVNPIGRLETGVGHLEGDFEPVYVPGDIEDLFEFSIEAGADGLKSLTHDLNLTLFDGNGEPVEGEDVATTLQVTQPADGGNPDADADPGTGDFTPYDDPTIYLVQVTPLIVEGRVFHNAGDLRVPDYDVALRITLVDPTPADLGDAKLVVEQFMAVDHNGDYDFFDTQLPLFIDGEGDFAGYTLGITLESTLTDGDNDAETSESVTVTLISDEEDGTSFVAIDDDGPQVQVAVDTDCLDEEAEHVEALGDDFLAAVDNPAGVEDRPRTAALDGGGSVVIWRAGAPDPDDGELQAQRFDADGNPVGTQIAVNTTSLGAQEQHHVAELPGGGFVVVWRDGGVIRARMFEADGDPISVNASANDFVVSTTLTGPQIPHVAALDNGDFMVVWQSGDGDSEGIYARLFNADGTAVDGSDFLVNTTTAGFQISPQVGALDSDAGFVVVWQAVDDGGVLGTADIVGQRFNADGTVAGGEFVVNGPALGVAGDQVSPSIVGLVGGGFVVVWVDTDLGGVVRGQLFDSSGSPDGGIFDVSTTSAGFGPELAALPDGGFVVTWGAGEVFARVYDASGNATTPNEFQVNTTVAGEQSSSDVAALTGGGFAVAFRSSPGEQDNFADVRARIFEVCEPVDIALNLDESTDSFNDGFNPDPADPEDLYAAGDVPDDNGDLDDVDGKTEPFLTTDNSSIENFGQLATDVPGGLGALFGDAVIDFGTDGALNDDGEPTEETTTDLLSLVLTGDEGNGGVQTNLVATELDGTALEGTSVDDRTVWLFLEGGMIVGRIGQADVGDNDPSNDYVVFTISLSNPDPDLAQLVVKQYLAIDHDASEPAGQQSPEALSLFDEEIALLIAAVEAGKSVGLQLDVTATDNDTDTVTGTAVFDLITTATSFLSFDDDGPDGASATNGSGTLVHDETPGDDGDADDVAPTEALDDLFDTVVNKGNDPHVDDLLGVPDPDDVIGYAQETLDFSILFDAGTDLPKPDNGDPQYAFRLSEDGVPSGLQTTEGTDIFLYDEGGIIVGRVGEEGGLDPDEPDSDGFAAFALHIDADSGLTTLVQYLSIRHDDRGDPDERDDDGTDTFDADPDEGLEFEPVQQTLASGTLFIDVTLFDGDDDSLIASADISERVIFQDDGPTLTIFTSGTGSPREILDFQLDETVRPDGGDVDTYDRYNTGELPQDNNGGFDDVDADPPNEDYNQTPVVLTNPATNQAIGHLSTLEGELATLFFFGTPDYGADGPLETQDERDDSLSLVLSTEPAETNLVVTALDGTPLEGLSEAQRTIWLIQVDDLTIEGRIAGVDGIPTSGDFLAFTITLTSDDPATALMQIDHFLPIDHDLSEPELDEAPENPSLFDEQVILQLLGENTLGLQLTSTVIDGDEDPFTTSTVLNLANGDTSFFTFDDDGPTVTAESICEDDGGDNEPALAIISVESNGQVGMEPDQDFDHGDLIEFDVPVAPGTAPFAHVEEILASSVIFDGGQIQDIDALHIFTTGSFYPDGSFVFSTESGNVQGAGNLAALFDGNPDFGNGEVDLFLFTATALDPEGVPTAGTISIFSDILFPPTSGGGEDFGQFANNAKFDALHVLTDNNGEPQGLIFSTESEHLDDSKALPGPGGTPLHFGKGDLIHWDGTTATKLFTLTDLDGSSLYDPSVPFNPAAPAEFGSGVTIDSVPDNDIASLHVLDYIVDGNGQIVLTHFIIGILGTINLDGDHAGDEADDKFNSTELLEIRLGKNDLGADVYWVNALPFFDSGDPGEFDGTEIDALALVGGDDEPNGEHCDPILIHDETALVQVGTGGTNANDQNDVAGASLPPAILALFNAIGAERGEDPDVDDVTEEDNEAIGFARSGAGNTGLTFTVDYGTDGPNATDDLQVTYDLTVTDGTFSGVQTTNGTDIYLYNGTGALTGLILGRVGSGGPSAPGQGEPDDAGVVAFALTSDPATGELFLAQYLSLLHPDAGDGSGGTYDELITLAEGTVFATVTIQDGDSDKVTSNEVDVGKLIGFQDDGSEAKDDIDEVEEGGSTDGNVLSGLETPDGLNALQADTLGSDGGDAAGGVAGVAGGDTATALDNPATLGVSVSGTWGDLVLNADGSYTYTQNVPVTDDETDVFTYTIKDGDGDLANATLTINIAEQENVPDAIDDTPDCIPESSGDAKTYSLLLILDRSGSMNAAETTLAVNALIDLLDAYVAAAAGGEAGVEVQIITFATEATTVHAAPVDVATALAFLTSLIGVAGSGNTNYDDAIEHALVEVNDWSAATPSHDNKVYFVSDGEPTTSNDGGNSLEPAEVAGWEAALTAKGATATAIGVGTGDAADDDLADVAFPDTAPGGVILVDDFETLVDALLETVPVVSTTGGNVLTNDTDGGDGYGSPKITQIQHNGLTYTLADADGGDLDPANDGTVVGNELTIPTNESGSLTINFETGVWSYIAPSVDDDITEEFVYFIQDSNGDTDDATLEVCVEDSLPVAYNNYNAVVRSTFEEDVPFDTLIEGFESGSGWVEVGDTNTSNSNVTEGSNSLQMSTGNGSVSVATLNTSLGLAAGSIEGLTTGDDEEGSGAYREFSANAGDSVSFDWEFDADDGGEDDAAVYFLMLGNTVIDSDLLRQADSNGSGTVSIGPLASAGTYRLVFAIVDIEDDSDSTDLYVDNIRLSGVEDVTSLQTVTGNVITDPNLDSDGVPDPFGAVDDPGTDGLGTPAITQFIHDSIAYTPASAVGGTVISNDGTTIVITTDLAGEFSFNFATGAYTYTAPIDSGALTETFTYRLTDGDGDFEDAVLAIDVVATENDLPIIFGTEGDDDPINGTAGSDVIDARGGDDTINGQGGNDFIAAGAGDDTIDYDVGEGLDTVNGGPGTDTVVVNGTGGNDHFLVETAAEYNLRTGLTLAAANLIAISTGATAAGPWTLAMVVDDVEDLVFNGNGGTDSLEIVGDFDGTALLQNTIAYNGGAGVDNVDGSALTSAHNLIASGGGGIDTLIGGPGNDTITGGDAGDSLTGGAGNDTYNYGGTDADPGENIVEGIGGGIDRIRTTTSIDMNQLTVNGVADLEGAGADEGIEQILIQAGTAATFAGAQLTGNNIAVNETGSGATALTIQVASGATVSFADLTFAAFAGGDAFDSGGDLVTIQGTAGNETITGTAIADTINGGAGADNLTGGAGDDTFNLANGDFASGESIDGGDDNDTIVLTTTALPANFTNGTVTNVETLTGSGGGDTVFVNIPQLNGFTTIDLAGGTDFLNIEVVGNQNVVGETLATISSNNVILIDSVGADTLTISGTQLNAILGTIGFANGGSDTLNLTSTSTDLNGLSDGNLSGLEIISAATAGAGVTISVASQTEGFTIIGSANADTLTGGGGADIITGSGGADTINVGGGNLNVVSYSTDSEFGDTILGFDLDDNNFATEDRIEITGALAALLDNVGAANGTIEFGPDDNINDNDVAVDLDTTFEALFLDGNNDGVSSGGANNLDNLTAVAAEFSAEFSITAADGQTTLLVINDNNANDSAVYLYTEDGGASGGVGEITAAELQLVAYIDNSNAAIATGNLDFV
jgi:hypothetical protein